MVVNDESWLSLPFLKRGVTEVITLERFKVVLDKNDHNISIFYIFHAEEESEPDQVPNP